MSGCLAALLVACDAAEDAEAPGDGGAGGAGVGGAGVGGAGVGGAGVGGAGVGGAGGGAAPALATQISVGGGHACALMADGAVRCFGSNVFGARGTGDLAPAPPNTVALGEPARQVAAGWQHTCVLLASGAVVCFGRNDSGQLGLGAADAEDHPTPAPVPGIAGATGIAAHGTRTCAIVAGGAVRCFGATKIGMFGGMDAADATPSPVEVPGLSGVEQLTVGAQHACARMGRQVLCWGWNNGGQLGTGQTAETEGAYPHDTPAAVPGLVVDEIAAGEEYTCVRSAGTVSCFGGNVFGELGSDAIGAQPVPATIAGLGDVTTLDAGSSLTCVVRGDGTVACLGLNNAGQLGLGRVDEGPRCDRFGDVTDCPPHPTPSVVMGVAGARQVSIGSSHACALLGDGTVRCWGDNSLGQRGAEVAPDAVEATTVPL